ncbi:OFA family MFS transporter [Thermogemmatispora carboxidivorans]|uniref:L-lactate MFS transporter n=1 Tax=Thermogemmatispora carboxidivorans TaxID=1382306 RepID=UPI00069AE489|nr:OFA family MFS transporter [Thermogemmatispora carboxidivorans]
MATATSTTQVRNRWIIVIAAIVMQLALGSVYAWSVFSSQLQKLYGWDNTQATLPFTIAILVLGIAAAIGGFWMDRVGPRIVGTTAAVCYGLGVFLAGFTGNQLALLCLAYGVLGGLGMGLGYIVPVATLVKWFPDKRGMVTGLAVFGFGGGAVIVSQVGPLLMSAYGGGVQARGIGPAFMTLGIIYLILIGLASQFYANPPAGYRPAGWTPSAQVIAQRATRDFTPGEALTRWQWYALWGILALNVTAGIAMISQAKQIALGGGAPDALATLFVSLISIFNACGRFVWAWLSDLIGRRQVFMIMFALQVVLFLLMAAFVKAFAIILVPALLVALCYGGGFGTMPAFTADYFGPKNSGSIYGLMLTAWSAGGVLGPILIAQVKDRTGGYVVALVALAIIMALSFLLPLLTRPPRIEAAGEAAAPA